MFGIPDDGMPIMAIDEAAAPWIVANPDRPPLVTRGGAVPPTPQGA